MGPAVLALLAYIAVIIVWNGLLKRHIGEAMIVAFVVLCLCGTTTAASLFVTGIEAAFSEPIVFAAMLFTFLGSVFTRTGLIDRQVDILNSVLGRVRGGAGYVSTVAAALFGSVSHGGSGNAAAVGSVTIPWMNRSNWPPRLSATIVAGNAGLGTVIPPSPSLLILAGSAAVAPFVSLEELLLPGLIAAGWMTLYRLALVALFVRRNRIGPVSAEDLLSFRQSLRRGWTSLLILVGIAIPVVLTIGPLGAVTEAAIGGDAFDAIDIVIWIPVLMLVTAIAVGWRHLPRGPRGWLRFTIESTPRFTAVGATVVFAFAASATLSDMGLSDQLGTMLGGLAAPKIVVVALVGLLILLVAGPLPSAATIAAIGGVAFSVLTAAGVAPIAAATAILVFSSTEGASPPGAAPIYIASGLAEVNPVRTFVPLIVFYVVPMFVVGVLVALGVLPIAF